jgi:DNA-binding transcriptional regulator YhcF (GntR family)
VNITVDTSSPVPPFEQIRAAVAELIAVGALAPETPLPSVRQLATDLGLAAGTVQRAYTELRLAGLVCTRSRQRVVVAPLADDEHGVEVAHLQVTTAARRYVQLCRLLGADDGQIRRAVRDTLSEGGA